MYSYSKCAVHMKGVSMSAEVVESALAWTKGPGQLVLEDDRCQCVVAVLPVKLFDRGHGVCKALSHLLWCKGELSALQQTLKTCMLNI